MPPQDHQDLPLQQQVVEEMAKHLGVSTQDIDLASSLSEDLGLGPVELSDLLSYLSEKFEVEFDSEEIEHLRSVNDIAELIEDLSLE
jgi:acyl carrier protein